MAGVLEVKVTLESGGYTDSITQSLRVKVRASLGRGEGDTESQSQGGGIVRVR